MPTRSVASDVARTQLNSIRGCQAKARIDANRPESSDRIDARDEFVSLIRAAMKDADMSQKAFALNAGVPESVISDGFNGVRNFAADWLWNQPALFWIRLRDRIDEAKQLSPENNKAIRAARIGELVKLLVEVGA
jgi:predicted XRE-type DNA-binding protein